MKVYSGKSKLLFEISNIIDVAFLNDHFMFILEDEVYSLDLNDFTFVKVESGFSFRDVTSMDIKFDNILIKY